MPSEWIESHRIAFSSHDSPLVGAKLSHNAEFLAVGYGKQVDVWDLRKDIYVWHAIYESQSVKVSFFAWDTDTSRLVVGHGTEEIYVVSFNTKTAAIEGIASRSLLGPDLISSAIFLGHDLLVIALRDVVEIRALESEDSKRSWKLVGRLPDPPVVRGDLSIKSIHRIGENEVLIHRKNSMVEVRAIVVNPFSSQLNIISMLSGTIDDVCPETGLVLVTDRTLRTYSLLPPGSDTPIYSFIPRSPLSLQSQPVSHATFLSKDLIIGAGVDQLVLWSIPGKNRLQNIPYKNQSEEAMIVASISCAYREVGDSGWIVTSHNLRHGGQVILWRTFDYELPGGETIAGSG